uniref:Uncharacterized protein n=1 Tax=Cucumis melo TaxID=3656 RepID=A0A9I9CK61_CUCME
MKLHNVPEEEGVDNPLESKCLHNVLWKLHPLCNLRTDGSFVRVAADEASTRRRQTLQRQL